MITIVKYGDFPQIKRRVKNPIFNRITYPLPWFIVDVYDTRLDFVTFSSYRSKFLYKEYLSIEEMFVKWRFNPHWLAAQGFGTIASQYHHLDFWLVIRAYPGYIQTIPAHS